MKEEFPEDAEVLTSSEAGCVTGDVERVVFAQARQGFGVPSGLHVLICDY